MGLHRVQRQSIWVTEKGKPLDCVWVDPDWLNRNAGTFQAQNYGIKIRQGKRQMP